MKTPRLIQDIQAQPDSLSDVLKHHSGEGKITLSRAAAMLSSANKVIITGMGASMFAGVALEYRLSSMGIPAFLVEGAELLHYRHRVCSDSVVIVVSRSGESIETEKLVKVLKGSVPVIGVSNNPSSMLATESNLFINICSRPDEMVAIQTYTGTVLTLHLLAAAVAGSLADEIAHLRPVLKELAPFIQGELDDIQTWDELLQLNSPVYVLGRGPSYATVLEGVLLFHETAKAAAVGMHAATFRHGPVEMVDGCFAGIVFAPLGRTRELNLSLARDLARFGGKVCVIGPDASTDDGIRFRFTPQVPEELAPLFEVVPLQCAALRLAQLRGLEIGTFRYTPQVTRSELSFVR